MARNIGPTVDTLLARVRQSGGIALDTDFATQLLTISQQIANAKLRSVVASGPFVTTASQLVYTYAELTAGSIPAIDILNATTADKKLYNFKRFEDLSAYDLDWFRATGSGFYAWCQIARDFFVLYPAKTGASSVNLWFTKLTTVYTDYSDAYDTALELPDEDVEVALKIAEVLALLRSRKPEKIKRAVADVMKRFGA
jgi:RES domain-containing protein